jgi:hypothetical protein
MSIVMRPQSRVSGGVAVAADIGAGRGAAAATLARLSPRVAVVAILVLGALGTLVFGAGLARAAEPWWRLSSGSP